MKTFTTFLFSIFMVLGFVGNLMGQEQLYIEDFEDASVGYTSSIEEVTNGSDDYFIRTDGSDISASFTNIQGSSFFAAQDIDGEAASSQQTLTFNDINVAGYEDLEFRVYLAEDDGSGENWDSHDFVHFDYDLDDSGSFNNLLWVENIGGTNAYPAIDTDFDGTGDGTEITSTFQQFSASISGTGGSLDLRITIDLNDGGTDIAIDNVEIIGTSTGGTPTKLVITEINEGNSPSAGTPFGVIVQAQDGSDTPQNVSSDVSITLTKAGGNGNLGGTLTGTISSGTNQTTISGVTYDTDETGVSITASDDATNLTAGTSSTFDVLEAANQLIFVNTPSGGVVDSPLPEFTVEARRSNNSVDLNYSSEITLSINTGTGTLGGTTAQSATDGVATYNDITINADGDFTLEATDGTLTSNPSSTIEIVDVDIVLNEILADPPADTDVNGDGNNSTSEDEFIEFVNTGNSDLDISNWTIDEGAGLAHTFPASTILKPMQAIVIFSGGTTVGDFGGSLTQISTENFALNNTGDDIILKNDSGIEILNYTYGNEGGNDVSITRDPDLTGGFSAHTGTSFSPGTRIDGAYFQPSIEITGDAGWRMLSFPVTGGTVEDISDNTAIQGISGGDFTEDSPNFLLFKSGSTTANFDEPSDVSTAFGDGYGFIVYFYDNTNAGSSELPITLDAFGNEPASDVTVNLNDSGDYTLVGNPFASNFDLGDMTSDGTIQTNVQFWDDENDTYDAVDHNSFIASSWQGFWIESSDGTTLTLPTSGKTDDAATDTYFSKENQNQADLAFTLSSESTFDKAIRLSFREQAEIGWDLADASKFTPLTTSYATMAFVGDDKMQSVFSLPYGLEDEYEVQLQETLEGVSGEFTFAWEGMESLPADWNFTLHDYETGESINMRHVDSYTFEAEGTAQAKEKVSSSLLPPAVSVMKKSKAVNRFGITVMAKTSVDNQPTAKPQKFALEQNYPNPFNPATVISYQVPVNSPVNLTVYNVMGQRVATLVDETKAPGAYRVSWDAAHMASGIYYYRLQAAGEVFTRQMTLIK